MTKRKYGEEIADRVLDLIEINPMHIDKFYRDMKNQVSISTLEVIEKLVSKMEKESEKKSSDVSNIPPLFTALLQFFLLKKIEFQNFQKFKNKIFKILQ